MEFGCLMPLGLITKDLGVFKDAVRKDADNIINVL